MKRNLLFIVEPGKGRGGVETIIDNIRDHCNVVEINSLKKCLNTFCEIDLSDYNSIILNQPYSTLLFILYYNFELLFHKKYYIVHINFSRGKAIRKLFKSLFFFILKSCSFKLIFFSKTMASQFEQKKIVISPPCLNENLLEESKAKKWGNKEIDFVFVGRLEHQKGADMLEKIADRLAASGYRLNVIGGGSIKNFVGNKNINYHGEKNLNEVYKILGNSKVLVFPSRFEGFGIVIVEALFFGCKVAGFNCDYGPSDILRIFKKNISLVKTEAVDELIENCLTQIRNEPDLIPKNKFVNFYGKYFISQLK